MNTFDDDPMGIAAVAAVRADRSPTLGALAKAKAQAQAKFLPLGKDKTANAGKYSYGYADLATCLEAVVPALSEVGIAVFQPTRVDESKAIATTLLVHESNEFISGDFAVAIVDPTDAQSIGSATTYARRYGLLAMLAYAAGDEDDDGQAARGGDHEMKGSASASAAPACPACGVVGSIMKGSEKFGGGILCWAKRGGCGAKWPDGTAFPPTAPPPEAEGPKPRAKREPKPPVLPAAAAVEPPAPAVYEATAPPPGSEDCEVEGCWGGRGHLGDHVFEEDAEKLKTPPLAVVPVSFTYGGKLHVTQGITMEQMVKTYELAPAVDKRIRKGYARELLGKILRKPPAESSRNDLTEAQAAKFLTVLETALAMGEVEVEP
jgi:hypothetical protein